MAPPASHPAPPRGVRRTSAAPPPGRGKLRELRHLGDTVSPGALSLGRLLVASAVLGLMLLTRPRRWPTRRDLPLLLACGVLWFGVYNISLNAAEQRIDAGTAAMLAQIGPIIVALLAAVFLGEPLTRWLVGGAVVGGDGEIAGERLAALAPALGFPVRTAAAFSPGEVARGLDLGCAVGRSTFEMARHCRETTGVDFSRSFIQAAETLRQ